MNLLIQLLPYAMFAVLVVSTAGLYVVRQSRYRRRSKTGLVASAKLESTLDVTDRAAYPSNSASTDSVTKPTSCAAQVLRLHELGIAETHIAAALEMPLQEVEIVVRMDQARRSRQAPREIAQPIS